MSWVPKVKLTVCNSNESDDCVDVGGGFEDTAGVPFDMNLHKKWISLKLWFNVGRLFCAIRFLFVYIFVSVENNFANREKISLRHTTLTEAREMKIAIKICDTFRSIFMKFMLGEIRLAIFFSICGGKASCTIRLAGHNKKLMSHPSKRHIVMIRYVWL